MSIKIKNLTFSYDGKNKVLDDVSLEIKQGEFLGVMGQTGCGKSTLVQIIAGLIDAPRDTVFVDGEDIFSKKYDRRKLRKKLGIVFQYPESQLFEQSVERDIAFGLKQFRLSKNEIDQRVKWSMELMELNYDRLRFKSPLALSGGEKRKVAISGVIVTNPSYLILDEPIAGLDPKSRDCFLNMLLTLKNQGTTIIMVSHNSDSLAEYADRIVVLNEGRIYLDDSPNEVFSNVEKLNDLGLGTCNTKEITHLLLSKGVAVSNSAVKYNDLLNELIRIYGK